ARDVRTRTHHQVQPLRETIGERAAADEAIARVPVLVLELRPVRVVVPAVVPVVLAAVLVAALATQHLRVDLPAEPQELPHHVVFAVTLDRKSTRLNSSHVKISY